MNGGAEAATGAGPRALAATIVQGVLGAGSTLDTALAATLPADLPGQDRALVQSLSYGALRWHHRHRALLARLLRRPLGPGDLILEALLSVGLAQLRPEGPPAYAAVSATVAATRLLGRPGAAGLVNGVLRRYQREAAVLDAALDREPTSQWSHPEWLVANLRADWPTRWESVLAANQQHPPLWLRVNRRRGTLADYRARLRAECQVEAGIHPGVADGLCLGQALPVASLPGFAAGAVSIQDAASQLAAPLLLGPDRLPDGSIRVLDACAAPGGKTAHLLELAPEAEVTALDIAPERLERLAGNLARLGLSARVIVGDALQPPTWWDGQPFDRILLDAPCSATGVIRRHPDIKLLRRPGDLPALAARQRQLLETLWPLLRSGGRLLYATCSLLAAENTAVIAGFCAAHPEAELLPLTGQAGAGLWAAQPGPGSWLLPGAAATDGFYYALMTRVSG